MRRFFIVISLIFALMTGFAGCSLENSGSGSSTDVRLPKTDAILTGKITHIYNGTCLLAGIDKSSELYTVPTSLDIYGIDGQTADESALKPGQIVKIGFSGSIMESFPAQLSKPVYIKINEQGDDLVGFYQKIINDLWDVDSGLNSDISVLAFDLSQATNLSAAEKSALVYIVSNEKNVQGITGTFDELCEQGYIDKKNLYFETGLLFEFKLTNVAKDSFNFDASKWRGGDGAYMFNDCKAVKNNTGWKYTIGSQAIS